MIKSWANGVLPEYLTAFRRLELDTGLGKLDFGFFHQGERSIGPIQALTEMSHGLSEIEGRSEVCMFNRLFFEFYQDRAFSDSSSFRFSVTP
jgi:hypothetical protein